MSAGGDSNAAYRSKPLPLGPRPHPGNLRRNGKRHRLRGLGRPLHARSSPPTMQLRPRPQTPFEVSIDPYLCNVGGTLHGGAASTILDNLTSEALHIAARKGWIDYGSVSRTLTVTFLRPVVTGSKVRVGVEVVQAGRTTANVKGVIRDAEGRVSELCA